MLTSSSPLPADETAGPPFIFKRLDTDDGLSDDRVFHVFQDHRGFMWLGTRNGLNRFDGHQVKVYKHDPEDPRSLPGNDISFIFEDSKQSLWIGTSHGLARLASTTGQFIRYLHDPGDTRSLSDDRVLRMFEDSRGQLWLAGYGGLDVLDPDSGQVTRHTYEASGELHHNLAFGVTEDQAGNIWAATARGMVRISPAGLSTRFDHDPSDSRSLSHNNVVSAMVDRAGVLWVATRKGLNQFDPRSEDFVRYLHDPRDLKSLADDFVCRVFEDAQGGLWIGHASGIDKLDRTSNEFTRFELADNPAIGGASDVLKIHEDGDGILWVGARKSLYHFERKSGRFQAARHDPSDPSTISHDRVRDLFEDRSGLLWVGTVAGVNRVVKMAAGIRPLPYVSDLTGISEDANIRCLREDAEGTLWAGTGGGTLAKLPRGQDRWQVVSKSETGSGINAIVHDRQGVFWLGTKEGLVRFDLKSNSQQLFQHTPGRNNVWAICPGDEQRLWLGTQAGLKRFDTHTSQFEPLNWRSNDPVDITSDLIHSVLLDRDGTLWIGSWLGLSALEPESGRIEQYRFDPRDPRSISGGAVYAICASGDGDLWFGTATGLSRLDQTTRQFTRFSTKDGLPQDIVQGVAEDASGALWVTTRNGVLCRIAPDQQRFTRFSSDDGIAPQGFAAGSIECRHGRVHVGGTGASYTIRQEQLADIDLCTAELTDFQLAQGGAVPAPTLLARHAVSDANEVSLTWDERFVTFHFAALSYLAPEKHRYRYRLQGRTDGWIEIPAGAHSVAFAELPPGAYTLQVTAANHRGEWNPQGASIRLTVKPPWWETRLFRSVMAALALAVLGLAYWARTRSLRRRTVELQREIDERHRVEKSASQLRENLIRVSRASSMGELAASIAHEVNQPLSAIVSNAEAAMRLLRQNPADPEEIDEALTDIVKDGNRAADVLLRVRAMFKKESSRHEPLDLNQVVRQVADLTADDAARRGISLELRLADHLPIAVGDAVELQQVLLNLILNALQAMQGMDLGSPRVVVTSEDHGDEVRVSVQDAGPGIDPTAADDIFEAFYTTKEDGMGMGLSINRTIIQHHAGRIWVTSNPDAGATFHVGLPAGGK